MTSFILAAETAEPNIAQKLGIDLPGLVAQILIFMVVYWVLSKYAFGPVTAMLEKRRARIAEGEEKLKLIADNEKNAQAQVRAALDSAQGDATRIIKEAQDAATALREKSRQDAISEANLIIAKAKEASQMEHDKLMAELKRDFGRLIVDTTSKVTGKVLTGDDHNRINSEALAQIKL